MGMGTSKSKKGQKEPVKFFERERWKEQTREEKKKKNMNPKNKRTAAKEAPLPLFAGALPVAAPAAAVPTPSPSHVRSYDEEALNRMRYQLLHDSDAFLLNNILLSVQFFENYDRETSNIKSNPISEREHLINEAMLRFNKHVFFADRLQECVHENVNYQRERGQSEPLTPPRLFVIYDNIEASEPGDTSDYSAVLDAPFYKLRIEDCKESGYVKLRKLEVLESTLPKDSEDSKITYSDESLYTDSEKDDSDDSRYVSKGKQLLQKIETKLKTYNVDVKPSSDNTNNNTKESTGRRRSGLNKYYSSQVEKSNISNMSKFKKTHLMLPEESDVKENNSRELLEDNEIKPRKSILKTARRPSGPTKEPKNKQYFEVENPTSETTIAEDTETSGYRSNSSSKHNESSETESDYGYTTITELTTPKKVELSESTNKYMGSGVLPDECWLPVQIRAVDDWSEDEDEELDDNASKMSLSRRLYETFYYLSSLKFMNNFVDNFIINLGSGLGLSQEAINNALTQGASIYFDCMKNGTKMSCEVFPALIASWPDVANQWIIRERRIIQNPRTNFSYQWPTKYMVNKAIGFGCFLVPIGFRPKRGLNPEQTLQWRIIFPAAERYLESCLAHSHVRCYLFALILHKTFMENNTSKIGIDASHIKNHLFWQCEDNYAKWPEDRLGETLRIFLRSFYIYFAQDRFPNYFMESCNDFKSIPKPLLRKNQKCLADILESPVINILKALDKLKYTKKDFYPTFNSYRLYEILTCKNPMRILNPNLPVLMKNNYGSSDESEEDDTNFWNKVRSYDKHYQWKKERQRQIQERRKIQLQMKKQKMTVKQEKTFNTNIILPKKLDVERRRLVLEFFVTHFIAMARSSERFEAIRQAVIYLEQAQRLCVILTEEPGGELVAEDYLDVIRDKLADCQRKLAGQGGFKLPRRESQMERDKSVQRLMNKRRPRYENFVSQDSPTENHSITPFTFVDVHTEQTKKDNLIMDGDLNEESKL